MGFLGVIENEDKLMPHEWISPSLQQQKKQEDRNENEVMYL